MISYIHHQQPYAIPVDQIIGKLPLKI